MSVMPESAEFRNELPGWAVRGVLCAANSAFWAWMLGFQAPVELAGMVAGVAVWAGIFALLCVWSPLPARWAHPQFAAALKWAAGIKIGLTAVGWLSFAVASHVRTSGAEALAALGMVDMLLGMAALWLVSRVAGIPDFDQVARLDSFGWTALTTMVEGALMAAVIGLIALLVLAWWRWGGLARLKTIFSPVQSLD